VLLVRPQFSQAGRQGHSQVVQQHPPVWQEQVVVF
jgi:hypothetical protein